MGYRKVNSIVRWWYRNKIESAIKNFHLYPNQENKSKLIGLLPKGLFYIAVKELPNIPTDQEGRMLEDTPIKYLTGTGPEGRVLFCFTSIKHLRRINETAGSIVLNLHGIFQYRSDDLKGFVINPKGPSVFISWDEVKDLISVVENNPP